MKQESPSALVFLALGGLTLAALLAMSKPGVKGVGQLAQFPAEGNFVRKLQGYTDQYLAEWAHPTTQQLARRIGGEGDPVTIARRLHHYVNNQVPYVEDPPGQERLMSPADFSARLLRGEKVGGDCDDKALLLAALAKAMGIPASVAFFDTDKDGEIDHAIPVLFLNGRPVYAEVTVPGKALGWEPPTGMKEALALPAVKIR